MTKQHDHETELALTDFYNAVGDALNALMAKVDARARAEEREACAKVCEDYSADRWAAYKGRAPYEPMNPRRADCHTQGESSGADDCAAAIRARAVEVKP